jgi:DNA-binding CsgD family transcriptional regulator
MQLQRALDIEQQVGLGAIANNGYLPSYAAGQSCRLDGRLEDAEAHWARLLGSCRTAGLEFWRADALMRLSLLALCRGDLSAGGALSAEGLERAEQFGHPPTIAALLWVCGEVAALQGRVDEARGFAERGMAEAAAISGITFKLRNEALLGTVDLALGNFRASADRLAPLAISWRSHCARFLVHNGIDVQAVEALIGAGDLAKAERLIEDMAGNAYSILGAAIIAGCRGHLAAARGELHSAVAQLTHALDLHEQISPHPLARAQVLLVLGGVQLRLKERALARATLSAALSVFECAGAPLLAERARAVLGRISGRAAGTAELTTTEMRVAELVASGRTNKEAAAELFVSVRAIESTHTKAYAKLGVRSRTELAARLQQLSQPTPRRTVVATELSS